MLTECGLYLPWAMEKFKNNGGLIIKKCIKKIKKIPKDFDIIINCTGLGAKYLLNDHKLIPIRGQVLKVCIFF